MTKLSKRQQRLIELMQAGWEVGFSHGWAQYCWAQKNGLGYGGETENINLNTIHSLMKRGLITYAPRRKKDGLDLTRYKLTDKGKAVRLK